MSKTRQILDFPRSEPGLVDKFLGTSYDVIKEVYDNLDMLKELHAMLKEAGYIPKEVKGNIWDE